MKIIDKSDWVWMWVHQKYVMSGIVWKLHSFETNNCSYISVPDDGFLNQPKKRNLWPPMHKQ